MQGKLCFRVVLGTQSTTRGYHRAPHPKQVRQTPPQILTQTRNQTGTDSDNDSDSHSVRYSKQIVTQGVPLLALRDLAHLREPLSLNHEPQLLQGDLQVGLITVSMPCDILFDLAQD